MLVYCKIIIEIEFRLNIYSRYRKDVKFTNNLIRHVNIYKIPILCYFENQNKL